MVAVNDITGDAIRSRDSAKYAENYDKIDKVRMETRAEFLLFYCKRCHIKVATNNGHCPCCEQSEYLEDVK